jgi:hypothetical protein
LASPSAGTWACCWPDPPPPPPPPSRPVASAAQSRLAACRGEGRSPILRHHPKLLLESSACNFPSVSLSSARPSHRCALREDPVASSKGKPCGISIKPDEGVGGGISVVTLIGGENVQGVAGRGAVRDRKRKAAIHLEVGSSSIGTRAASRFTPCWRMSVMQLPEAWPASASSCALGSMSLVNAL